MRNLLLIASSFLLSLPIAHAEVKDWVYDGKEIYVRVKKDHVTTVIFPETVKRVIRGFAADSYVIQRNSNEPNTLEFMPTSSEIAEMSVYGVSSEDYVLRFIANDEYYSKLTIHKAAALEMNKGNTIESKMDILPQSIIVKQKVIGQSKEASSMKIKNIQEYKREEILDLPPELNLKITLKGNDLPLRIYFSTISEVTGYNIVTTPDIDNQKTSINLERIEVWRALKSLLYKFGFGFKVSRDDLIITDTETRIFNINMPAVEQAFTDETSNATFADSNNSSTSNGLTGNQQNQDIRVGTKIYYENSSPKLSL